MTAQRITMPALIVQVAHGAAMVQGLPLPSGKVWHKTVECRGPAAAVSYRGAVAIFGSRNYDASLELEYAMLACAIEGRALPPNPALQHKVSAWCVYASAWRYRLLGYVALERAVRAASVRSAAERRRLHAAAGDWSERWSVSTYLEVRAIYECQDATGPRFDEVCAGCLAAPPHNAAACHVNFQTISIEPRNVPRHVQEEVRPWQPKQQQRRR